MVAWSFLGIRKNSEFKKDLAQVNPFHVIAVGIRRCDCCWSLG